MAGPAPRYLIGRDAESAAVEEFFGGALAGLQGALRVLLIEGEAGIGKSAMVSAAIRTAAVRGWRVRVSRPTEAEVRFAYAGLADLLEGPDVELPPLQRHALDVALRRIDADVPLDPHAVTLATVAHLTRNGDPVLIVVDDVPWLDGGTARVLAAAMRRLADAPIRLLLTRRANEPGAVPWELHRHLPPERCRTLWLTGLSADALRDLLEARLRTRFPRGTLARFHAVSRGNPFYALQLAQAWRDRGEDAPLPASLTSLVAARLDALDADSRDVLLMVAALAVPKLSRLRAATSVSDVDAAVERLEAAGLVAVSADGSIAFDHPLVASVVYGDTAAPERRALHRRLAEVEPETEARARHLALGTLGPDDKVADRLERAAHDAGVRGAYDVAADLLGLALAHTTKDRSERSIAQAECLFYAGDPGAAAGLLDAVLPDLPHGLLRARALLLRGTAGWYLGAVAEARERLVEAVDDAHDDPGLLGLVFNRLALFCEDDLPQARRYAEAAVASLEAAGDKHSLAGALCNLFFATVQTGGEPRPELIERAVQLEDPRGSTEQSTIPAIWYLALDRWDEARQRYEVLLGRNRARGDLTDEPDLLNRLADTALHTGDWAAARAYAEAAVRSARLLGDSSADPSIRIRLLLDAYQGRLDEVGPAVETRANDLAAAGDRLVAAAYLAVAAFVAASAGDLARVLTVTGQARAHFAALGIVEPVSRIDPIGERLEALVGLGRFDEAARELSAVEARLVRVPRPWLRAAWCRASAELAAAGGNLPAGIALATPPPGVTAFDRARTLLTRGRLLRRARRISDAAGTLDTAAEIFTDLGAPVWAARVEQERSRLGLSRSGGDRLTPTEMRVATLAAAGATNRAVATALAMSPKTVEAHLSRIYRKLGIRSRAQLGALAGQGDLR
jgi:DNA-binding CsgD family transcriptional regulator/tetratricopeptide (TPR) repeat protein